MFPSYIKRDTEFCIKMKNSVSVFHEKKLP